MLSEVQKKYGIGYGSFLNINRKEMIAMNKKPKPCIKQPSNPGVACTNRNACEKCGWNPEFIEKCKKEGKL